MNASSRGRNLDGSPNLIDLYVGKRLRLRRKMLKISQEKLACLLGLTFQQIQKYELGKNRISASRLWDLSQVLGVAPDFFYEDMDEKTKKNSPRFLNAGEKAKESAFSQEDDLMQRNETLELVSALEKIKNTEVVRTFSELIYSMAANDETKTTENTDANIDTGQKTPEDMGTSDVVLGASEVSRNTGVEQRTPDDSRMSDVERDKPENPGNNEPRRVSENTDTNEDAHDTPNPGKQS